MLETVNICSRHAIYNTPFAFILPSLWSAIRSTVNVKQKSRYQTSNLIIKKKVLSNHNTTANHFDYFFTSVASKNDKMIGPSNKIHHDYPCNPNENFSYLSLICKENTEDKISTRRTDKACGLNNIPIRILEDFKK